MIRVILFLGLLALVGTPTSAQLKLVLEGPEWLGVKEWPVSGRQGILIKQRLAFGDHRTDVVDRSWTRGSSAALGLAAGVPGDDQFQRIITSEWVRKSQTLYFEMTDGRGNRHRAYSVSKFKSRDLYVGNNPNSVINIFGDILGIGDDYSNLFFVMIYDSLASQRWELLLDNGLSQQKPKEYVGYLSADAQQYYTIRPLSKVVSKKGKVGVMPFGSAGFEIRRSDGTPVAAVSLIDKGIVYLANHLSPDEANRVATACAALLLQEQLE